VINTVKFFIELYPEIWEAMDTVSHNYKDDSNFPNKHHLEGTVASHTLLIMLSAAGSDVIEMDYVLTMILLLHDVGKPFSYSENDELTKRGFAGHSIKSFEMSPSIIKQLCKKLHISFDAHQLEIILNVIKNHDYFIKNSFDEAIKNFDKETLYYLAACNYYDNLGRVSSADLGVDITDKLDILHRAIENRFWNI